VTILVGVAWLSLATGGVTGAATIELHPGASFEAAVESLNPGDTLVVHAGTYADTGRISVTVKGTAEAPVAILGAAGEARPVITRPAEAQPQNTINIEGASHLTIRGLEIRSNGGDGINVSKGPSYITLEDLEVHDVDVGINFKSTMHHITVRHNHIHHTGDDGGTGEGMYVGCNDGSCAVSDALIEGNWIHDTLQSTQGDGIEIKLGSHSNIVRNNVIHDTRYPCILLYGTQGQPRNVVEGNALWNCGDSGIQAAADAILRNNLILASPENGFNSQEHQGATPANLEFVHNTLIGGSPCLRLVGWSGKPGLVLANNAVYCETGGFQISGLAGVVVAGNVVFPPTAALPAGGFIAGRSVAQDFLNAADLQAYPTGDSPLVGAASAAQAAPVDFNGTPRTAPHDAGAYEWSRPQNPGWPVQPGFKGAAAPPNVPPTPTGLELH